MEADIVELNDILAAEIRGETLCRSSGTDCSTGLPGDGNNAANRRAQIADTQRLLDDATAQRSLVQASRDAKQLDVNALQAKVDLEGSAAAEQGAAAQAEIDAINEERDTELAAATASASEADGCCRASRRSRT